MDISLLLKQFAEAISPALQVLLQAVLVGLAAQVSAWIMKAYQVKKNQLSQDQQYLLQIIVSTAVRAAEQLYSDGADKRTYAFSIVEKQLAQYGLVVDIDVIYAEIEAKVGSISNSQVSALLD